MELKKFLVNKLILFFLLSTLITAAVALIGNRFDSAARLSYLDLLTPIRYAALCLLPSLVTYSKRELSPKKTLLRKLLMLVLLEAVIGGIAFMSPAIDTSRPAVVLSIAGSVLLIFVLANLFLWLKDAAEAKKLIKALEQFQQSHAI